MKQTVRARALALEAEARRYDLATAINVLAVRVAQLEARCAEWQRRVIVVEAAEAALPEVAEYAGASDGPVG